MKTSEDILGDNRIAAYGRLVEAQRRLHRLFDRSLRDATGLSVVWFEALLRLARSPEQQLPINELGEQLVLTSGGATRLVDRLEENGYVARTACPEDRRVQWVRLTERGLAIAIDATRHHLGDLEEHFAAHMTSDEMATLSSLLDRLRG